VKKIDLYGDGIGCVEYIEHMGTDTTVVNAARVSFGKHKRVIDEKDEKLIRYLIKHRHSSPFEHCSVTFRFTVPLFVRSQHHRHRTWSYNEISRRYTSYDIKFYEPTAFRPQHGSNRQASIPDVQHDPVLYPSIFDEHIGETASEVVVRHHKESLKLFNLLIDKGVCREQARGILPQNMYTQYYGTVNMSNLIKFIDLRIHEGAQWEIQKVAEACRDVAMGLWPISMDAYRKSKCDS
jgi:thymidylate synthase (FAD)